MKLNIILWIFFIIVFFRKEFGFKQGLDLLKMGLGKSANINNNVISWLQKRQPDKFFCIFIMMMPIFLIILPINLRCMMSIKVM